MADKPNTADRTTPENISYAKLAAEVLVPVAPIAAGAALGGVAGAAVAGGACAAKEVATLPCVETAAKKIAHGVIDFFEHEKDLWKSILLKSGDR